MGPRRARAGPTRRAAGHGPVSAPGTASCGHEQPPLPDGRYRPRATRGRAVLDDGDTKAEKYGAAKSALVELLLARGARPNVCDDEGHSPLYHAGYQKRMGDVIRKAGGYRSNIET